MTNKEQVRALRTAVMALATAVDLLREGARNKMDLPEGVASERDEAIRKLVSEADEQIKKTEAP